MHYRSKKTALKKYFSGTITFDLEHQSKNKVAHRNQRPKFTQGANFH
jgi:hypothetical protein